MRPSPIFLVMQMVLVLLLPGIAAAATFMAGDRVQASGNINVRETPSATGTRKFTLSFGTQGTILSGGQRDSDHTWWCVKWDNGVGWSAEDYIGLVARATPAATKDGLAGRDPKTSDVPTASGPGAADLREFGSQLSKMGQSIDWLRSSHALLRSSVESRLAGLESRLKKPAVITGRREAATQSTNAVGWLALIVALVVLVLWIRTECRGRLTTAPAFTLPDQEKRMAQEHQSLIGRIVQLEEAVKTKTTDHSAEGLMVRIAKMEEAFEHLRQPVVQGAQTPEPAATMQQSAEAKTPPQPTNAAVSRLHQIDRLGAVYAGFCREQNEYLLAAFAQAIKGVCHEGQLHQIFRAGGAHEIYFTDRPEANPQCYWCLSAGRDHFLFPRPASKARFEGVQGFEIDELRPPAPQALRICRPAMLVRGEHRWELAEPGKLG